MKIELKRLLNNRTTRHKNIDNDRVKISATVKKELSFFFSFLTEKLALILDIIKGSPLDITVKSTINTDEATWYKPTPSAPTSRDKIILKIKPHTRVRTENTVISATVLNKDFISSPHICYLGGIKFKTKGEKFMKKEYNQIYIVKEGDNLEKIAEKYKVSPLSILITNNITPKMIKKGKVIFIKNNF